MIGPLTVTGTTLGAGCDPADIWIIKKGRYVDIDMSGICEGFRTKTVTEYELSDLGRYLLNPNPIQVKKKLIGCEICFCPPFFKTKAALQRVLPRMLHGWVGDASLVPEVLLSEWRTDPAPLKDERLRSHFEEINEHLKPYDPVIKRIQKLSPAEKNKISDVVGACRDIGGNLSYLNIHGNLYDKLNYVRANLLKEVGVVIEKAHMSDGLFEMKGFDFTAYDSEKMFRLVKFVDDGTLRACVLNAENQVEFWVEDVKMIHYLQLFGELIKMNPKLKKSLHLCTSGRAEPMKLFINRDIEIDYSDANLPEVYRRVFQMYDIEPAKKDIVTRVLNHSQLGVTFNYVPRTGAGGEKLFVNFSVMHNVKALDPLMRELPQVYSEINRQATLTEAGRYYLLDFFRGYRHEK